MNRTKKALIAALVLGALAAVGAGTYATFTAQTSNQGNSFATGTLVLQENVNGSATACLSTSGGATDTNVNTGCGAIVNLGVKRPGDSGTGFLAVQNVGSLAAGTFTVTANATPGCSTVNATGETYHGTGTGLCSLVDVFIQECGDAACTPGLYPARCVYPFSATAACAYNDANTIAALQTAGAQSPASPAGLAAGATRHFAIGLKLQNTAALDNTYQGRSASFQLDWNIQ